MAKEVQWNGQQESERDLRREPEQKACQGGAVDGARAERQQDDPAEGADGQTESDGPVEEQALIDI